MIIAAQIIGGLALLFFGGEALVRGAVSLATKLGISTLIIGLTIIAYGTSAPEMVVSIQAAIKDSPDIALGNIIGSNISNILLVLGATALILPIKTDASLLKREAPLLLLITVLLFAFSYTGNLTVVHAAIFLLITLVYTIHIFRTAKKTGVNPVDVDEEVEEVSNPKLAFVYLAAGFTMLVFGADILVEGASNLARIWGIAEATIAVTIVAIGSSAPELVTSLVAAMRGQSDIALGNIVGSCLFNIMGIMGITPLILSVSVDPRFLEYDFWVLMGSTILLLLFMYLHNKITRVEGGIMLVGYVAYLVSQIYL